MKAFWRGFFSVFEAMGDLFDLSGTSARRRIEERRKRIDQSKDWRHYSPWWDSHKDGK